MPLPSELLPLPHTQPRTALVLSGGGARAAYQVGVLLALRELLAADKDNPFPILCGASAGAINAAGLAIRADNFSFGVELLHEVWTNLSAGKVFRADPLSIGAAGAQWLSLLAFGWLMKSSPRSLLDNAPLRELLSQHLKFNRLTKVIDSGALHALSITCSGYASGQSVSFFQGQPDLMGWRRQQRSGAKVRLGVEHLMASSALPFVFPAVRLHREWFGDGAMRLLAPISPAIHLGATRILVIGTGNQAETEEARSREKAYPSLAQIAGHALSSIFLDGLTSDVESLTRINDLLGHFSAAQRSEANISLQPLTLLHIAPSQRLDHLATRFVGALPVAVRAMMRGIGAMRKSGGALASYLLFEQPYISALIELGRRDTLAQRDEVKGFLSGSRIQVIA